MARDGSPRGEGRRAWSRLAGWRPGEPYDGHAGGHGALAALDDIGVIRRLLDRAELVAVRSARHHGSSWAEIATRLGITRQSAWERWRDLDEAGSGEAASDHDVAIVSAGEARSRVAPTPGQRRRRGTMRVPDVIGMSWDAARDALFADGLVAVGPDPDGPPLGALGWPDGVVTGQSPESGAKVPPGTAVRLWIDRGGGSAGVREPRRPTPAPTSAEAARERF